MVTVSIDELQASLGAYFERVKAGEEVTVTEDGKTIARLVPEAPEGQDPNSREAMVRAGIIRKGKGPVSPKFWTTSLVPDPDGLALKALLEERETGR
ncbi:MAG: type II toxin-antitoxin system Phd/YefM family antitoxin [Dehalococcoidia bacterium]